MLKKFLVRDPVKRNTLEILIDDPWINESYGDSPISTDLSETVAEDENVIKLMESKFKIDRESVLQALRDNVYNDTSAIYFLLYYEKDNRTNTENDVPDITKIASPTKKDSGAATSPATGKAMPIIDENGVLPESLTESPAGPPGVVPDAKSAAAKTSAVVAAGRRRRAATVIGGDKNEESAAPIAPASVSNNANRPATGIPFSSSPSSGEPPKPGSETPAAIPPVVEQRKRHNTIVGIFKNQIRRNTDSDEVGTASVDSNQSDKPMGDDTDKPRSLRFTFNSNTTSSKPPDEIIVEVIKCCNKLGLTHRLHTRYLLECNSATGKEPLKFEIEVCKLPRLNNLHGLRFKRVNGSSGEYKDTCEKILSTVQL